jgi:hypothetical protein
VQLAQPPPTPYATAAVSIAGDIGASAFGYFVPSPSWMAPSLNDPVTGSDIAQAWDAALQVTGDRTGVAAAWLEGYVAADVRKRLADFTQSIELLARALDELSFIGRRGLATELYRAVNVTAPRIRKMRGKDNG